MKREEIENLLNRYLDGETTNEEERLLRQFFATTQMVPTEWKAYQALFRWEASRQTSAPSDATPPAPSGPARPHRLAVAASISATLLLGAGIAASLLHPKSAGGQPSQDYAVLDGRYTTDATVIAREAEEALLMVSATDEDTFEAIDILATP